MVRLSQRAQFALGNKKTTSRKVMLLSWKRERKHPSCSTECAIEALLLYIENMLGSSAPGINRSIYTCLSISD